MSDSSRISKALSISNLVHLLTVLVGNEQKQISSAFEEEGIYLIQDFIKVDPQEFSEFQYKDTQGQLHPFSRKHVRTLQNLQTWAMHLYSTRPTDKWNDLTDEGYVQFHNLVAKRTIASTSFVPQAVTSDPTASTVVMHKSSAFLANVKLDIKTFPTFDGKKEHWLKFKRSVLSIGYTHGLQAVLDLEMLVPDPEDADYDDFQAKNAFIYSMWVGRVLDGYPVSLIRAHESTRDGRAVYCEMVQYFESKNNLEQLTLLTFHRINDLSYNYKYPGGLPKFLHCFRNLMMDLQDSGKPMDPAMIKSLFLSKIQDREYKHLVDTYLTDPSKDFDTCAQGLVGKYECLTADKPSSTSRQSNNASSKPSGSSNGIKLTPEVIKEWESKWKLPKATWVKLSQSQKDHLWEIRRNKTGSTRPSRSQSRTSGNNSGNSASSTVPQSNYSPAQLGNMMVEMNNMLSQYLAAQGTTQVNNTNTAPQASSTPQTPSVRDIMRSQAQQGSTRSTNVLFTAFSLASPTSSTYGPEARGINEARLSACVPQGYEYAPVDSGADTVRMGSAFHIVEYCVGRMVDVVVYDPSIVTHNVYLGTGITACDLPDGTSVLLQCHEGVAMGKGKSLFSCNQMRHHGTIVDDVPHRYGGSQSLKTVCGHKLPLAYHVGLCSLHICLPSQDELDSLPIYDLTSPEEWCPQVGESDPYDGLDEPVDSDYDVTLLPVKTDPQEPNWDHIQKCFGWKPLDVVKNTYDHTTQYATSHLRLPMREHYKSRFPALNVRRIQEIVATDTFFASTKALGGETCAQLYVGKSSYYTHIFGMKSENQMADTLGDFICEVGAPYALLSDNAKSETSKTVKDYLRKYCIKDMQTEPQHPNQESC